MQLQTALGVDAAAAPYAARLLELHGEADTSVRMVAEFHVRFGRPDVAERIYRAALERRRDATSCSALAGFLNTPVGNRKARREEALDTIEGCAASHGSADLWVKSATFAWDYAYREPSLAAEVKRRVTERGLRAVDRALALAPEAHQALVYKGMLLRIKADLQVDPGARQTLLAEAEALRKRAMAAMQKQQSAAPSPSPRP